MPGKQIIWGGGGGNPTGTIISFMGTTAPTGYLVCDGTEYNISEYQALADHFELQFGSKNNFGGDGVITFKVPDLRGEFLRGTGTNSHSSQGSGTDVGGHQDATGIPYFYTFSSGGKYGVQHTATSFMNTDGGTSGSYTVYNPPSAIWQGSATNTGWVRTRPTNTSVLYCIKF